MEQTASLETIFFSIKKACSESKLNSGAWSALDNSESLKYLWNCIQRTWKTLDSKIFCSQKVRRGQPFFLFLIFWTQPFWSWQKESWRVPAHEVDVGWLMVLYFAWSLGTSISITLQLAQGALPVFQSQVARPSQAISVPSNQIPTQPFSSISPVS